jgi:hypothetical protein
MNYKNAANIGTIAAITSFIFAFIMILTNVNPLGNAKYLSTWIPILAIYLVIKKEREENNNYIEFGKAFTAGLITSFFWASLFSILFFLYGKVIDSNLIELYRNDVFIKMEEAKKYIPEKYYDLAIKEIENTSIGKVAFNDYWTKIIWATILSLIIALVMKKKKPFFEENNSESSQ